METHKGGRPRSATIEDAFARNFFRLYKKDTKRCEGEQLTDIEFDPVETMVVGAVGEPGQRTFMLQARGGDATVTLIVEKEQVIGLGQGALALLSQFGEVQPGLIPWDPAERSLDESDAPMWRVGQVSVAFDPDRQMALIECIEMVEEGEQPQLARFWLSKEQLTELATHGLEIAVKGGRPICPHCALPMDTEGHVCPATNGHKELPT